MREVIRHAVVLRDPVIPKRNVVLLPLPPQRELRFGRMREQKPKQRVALGFRHVHDSSQEALADEQRLPSTDGVGANQGMDHGGVLLDGVLPEGRWVSAAGVVVSWCGELLDEAVLRVEPEEEVLQNCWISDKERSTCKGFESASKAAMPLANRVSPPTGGMSLPLRMLARGGVSMKVTSVCQWSLSAGWSPSASRIMISSSSGPKFG